MLELFGELLEDVIGDDDQDLAGQTKPAQLHRRGRHHRRLPGADLMKQADGRFLEDSPDGRLLVRSESEGRVGTGERQVRAVVLARPDRVERVVVEAGQALGAIGVAPQPLDKPALERLGFFLCGQRLLLVDDAPAVVELVHDLGQLPVQKLDNDAQRRSARRTPVAEVPGGGDDRLRLEHPLGCLSDVVEELTSVA